MATWIITTGSEDVKLKNTDESTTNWCNLYPSSGKKESLPPEVKTKRDRFIFDGQPLFWFSEEEENENFLTLPPRVLGLVYKKQPDYYEDLAFPVISQFINYFHESQIEFPDRIIIFLTDQKNIFTENNKKNKDSAFWYDTCYLKPLIEWLIKNNTETQNKVKLLFRTIEPESSHLDFTKGIDHWDEMLKKVENLFTDIKDRKETIYVSHQAGTPAISSAVQFTTITNFSNSNIKFLIAHQYEGYQSEEYKPELINIPNYWQKIQIQKAKQLIIDGNVGAAKTLLEDANIKVPKLDQYVSLFNLKTIDPNDPSEFELEQAFDRIRNTLDLIEIFFRNENYLQGITLISAAQETFMKAAIFALIRVLGVYRSVGGVKVDKLLSWDTKGLFLKSKAMLENLDGFDVNNGRDRDLSEVLVFPTPTHQREQDYSSFRKYISCNNEFTLGNICPEEPKLDQNNQRSEKWRFELNNSRLLLWLNKLIKYDLLINILNNTVQNQDLVNIIKNKQVSPDDWQWPLLKWSCKNKREHEQDRRNQLMHNLRGVKQEDVLMYLYGNPDEILNSEQEVDNVYKQQVKRPFIKVLSFVRSLYRVVCLKETNLKEDSANRNYIDEELRKIHDSL